MRVADERAILVLLGMLAIGREFRTRIREGACDFVSLTHRLVVVKVRLRSVFA